MTAPHPTEVRTNATIVAVSRDGSEALYCSRNWRMGGKTFYVHRNGAVGDVVKDHTRIATGGREVPKPPTSGRWSWLPDSEWAR